MRLVRVDADRDSSIGPHVVDAGGLGGFPLVAGFENQHEAGHACLSGACHDLVQVVRKRVVREVAVAVDHGWVSYSARSASTGSTRTTRRAGT
jgi:hypothetical protein